MASRAQRGAVPRRRALPHRRAQRRGRPVRPHPPPGALLPRRRLHRPPRTVPGAGRRDPHGRHAGAPDGAGDDRRHGRADGRRHRLVARRAPALASARRHPGAVHQRQRSVDAGGVGLRDDRPLQPRAGRGQGAGARGGHPRADDRPLADGHQRARPRPRRLPLHRLGAVVARRRRPRRGATPPRRRRRPDAVAARGAAGAHPAAVLAVVALRADAVRQRRRARRRLEAALSGGARAASTSSRATRSRSAGSPPTPSSYRPRRDLERPDRRYERQTPQLFDLATDPGEQLDLAAHHPRRVAVMEQQLADWYASVESERAALPDERP